MITRENCLLPAEVRWVVDACPALVALRERTGRNEDLPDFKMADGSSFRAYIDEFPTYRIPCATGRGCAVAYAPVSHSFSWSI